MRESGFAASPINVHKPHYGRFLGILAPDFHKNSASSQIPIRLFLPVLSHPPEK